MTALDQAFIKAYRQKQPAPTPDAAPPVHESSSAARAPRVDKAHGDYPPAGEIAHLKAAVLSAAAAVELLPPEPKAPSADRGPIVYRVDPPLRPMLQVTRFHWPSLCRRLVAAAPAEIDRMTDAIAATATAGRKIVAIGSCQSGEGATTLLLCAAHGLTQRGRKVVMVDANLADPQLARRLHLAPSCGWEDALAGRMPLDEVVIETADNGAAVLPVRQPVDPPANRIDENLLAQNLRALRDRYDVVLVDVGPLEPETVAAWPTRGLGRSVESIMLVQNIRATQRDRIDALRQALSATGVEQMGVIQNSVGA